MQYPFYVRKETLTDGGELFGVYIVRGDGQRIASSPFERDAAVIVDRLNTALNEFSDAHPSTFSVDA